MRKLKKRMFFALSAILVGCAFGTVFLGNAHGRGTLTGYAGPSGPAADTSTPTALPSFGASSQNIRVLIMDTDFRSIFHPYVTLRAKVPMIMAYGGNEQLINQGEEITIMADDARLSGGSIVFRPTSAHEEIGVPSVKRYLGTPSYAGTLELRRENEGLTLINELGLENYLTKVIPSEMPTYYEPEALKAQAVCARTYSYNRIQTNVYKKYGAHVDDSVEFQVYNNVNTDARAFAAVMDTWGKLLTYNGTPVEGYFFSTSCGYTTDSTIWKKIGNPITGYLKGIPAMEGVLPLDLTGNDSFTAFIKDKSVMAYDSFAPFYRWETTVTAAQLAKKVPDIGTVNSIQIMERGIGGIAKVLKLQGTAGERVISGQEEIRAVLGGPELVITRKDKSTVTNWQSLPSAYIAVEAAGSNETEGNLFRIYGGGYGHGVGLSQNGAQGMAKQGKNYEEILKFFFSGVEVIAF